MHLFLDIKVRFFVYNLRVFRLRSAPYLMADPTVLSVSFTLSISILFTYSNNGSLPLFWPISQLYSQYRTDLYFLSYIAVVSCPCLFNFVMKFLGKSLDDELQKQLTL